MEGSTRTRKWLLTINNPVDHNMDHKNIIAILNKALSQQMVDF